MRKGLIILAGLWGLIGLVSCETLNPAPPTPILVSATPQEQFMIITNTPTPSASPVLAPTLPGTPSEDASPVSASSEASPSPTADITATPTFTPTPTDTPATPGAIIGPVGGAAAVLALDECPTPPGPPFNQLLLDNPDLAARLGCPLENGTPTSANNAFQSFEGGAMVWVSTLGGTGQGGDIPTGRVEPIRGFGKVWRESPGVGEALGWATAQEAGGTSLVQRFERGEMLYVPQSGQTYILVAGQPGTWTGLATDF
ncbi:MAG: LGFP repeat-containing protein [Anaerolineales bacterium]